MSDRSSQSDKPADATPPADSTDRSAGLPEPPEPTAPARLTDTLSRADTPKPKPRHLPPDATGIPEPPPRGEQTMPQEAIGPKIKNARGRNDDGTALAADTDSKDGAGASDMPAQAPVVATENEALASRARESTTESTSPGGDQEASTPRDDQTAADIKPGTERTIAVDGTPSEHGSPPPPPDSGEGTTLSNETNEAGDSDTADHGKSRRTAIRDAALEALSTGPGSAAAGVGLKRAAETAGVAEAADSVNPFLWPGAQGLAELLKHPPEVVEAMAKEAAATAKEAARTAKEAINTTVVGAAVEAASRPEPPSALAGTPEYAEVSTELPGDSDSDTTDALSAAIQATVDNATSRTDPSAASTERDRPGYLDETPALPDYVVPGYEQHG